MESTSDLNLILVAKSIGIASSFLGAGCLAAMTFVTGGPLHESPTPTMLRQWDAIFNFGKRTSPPVSTAAAAAYVWTWYHERKSPAPDTVDANSVLLLLAALSAVSVTLFTIGAVYPTNRRLWALMEKGKAVKMEKADEERAHGELRTWAALNLVRVGMYLGAGVMGLMTLG